MKHCSTSAHISYQILRFSLVPVSASGLSSGDIAAIIVVLVIVVLLSPLFAVVTAIVLVLIRRRNSTYAQNSISFDVYDG